MQHQYTPRAKPTEFLEMNCGGPQALRARKQFANVLCNRCSLSPAEPATSPQVLNLRTALCNRALLDTLLILVLCPRSAGNMDYFCLCAVGIYLSSLGRKNSCTASVKKLFDQISKEFAVTGVSCDTMSSVCQMQLH